MKFKKGVSAAGRLFIAALYYEKGDLQKAGTLLQEFPACRVAMINDEKQVLAAQVLAAAGKSAEAEALLNQMLTDKKTTLGRELILMLRAKMQIKNRQNEKAASSLKQIMSEYPDTPSAMEAQNLLSTLAGDSAPAR
jgi:predicted Zn-dependent protease